jgi:hypothetical protein
MGNEWKGSFEFGMGTVKMFEVVNVRKSCSLFFEKRGEKKMVKRRKMIEI